MDAGQEAVYEFDGVSVDSDIDLNIVLVVVSALKVLYLIIQDLLAPIEVAPQPLELLLFVGRQKIQIGGSLS